MSDTKSIPRLLTRQTVAKQLGVSVYAIDMAIKRSELPAYKLGGRILVAVADLEQWLLRCKGDVVQHKRENAGA